MGSIEFRESIDDTSGTNTYTFTGVDFGAAASDRYIIIGIINRKLGGATSITGVTIGGETATVLAQISGLTGNVSHSGLAIALVPTGATGTVVVNMAHSMLRCTIGVWRATGLSSPTPHDTLTNNSNNPSGTLDVVAGCAVGAGGTGSGGAVSVDWAGLTQDFSNSPAGAMRTTGAHEEFVSPESGRSIGITFSSNNSSVLSVASWAYDTAGVARRPLNFGGGL